MLLAVNTRRMLKYPHLTVSPVHFTVQFDFAVSDRYAYEKCILHCWVRQDVLTSALVTTSSPRLKARAWCGDLCWDELISPSQQCRMHITSYNSTIGPKQLFSVNFSEINVINQTQTSAGDKYRPQRRHQCTSINTTLGQYFVCSGQVGVDFTLI